MDNWQDQVFDDAMGDYSYVKDINEAYASLGAAIILQACKDYNKCLTTGGKSKKRKYVKKSDKNLLDDYPPEWFFKSEWFEMLSMGRIDSDKLMGQLRENKKIYGITVPTPKILAKYQAMQKALKEKEDKK